MANKHHPTGYVHIAQAAFAVTSIVWVLSLVVFLAHESCSLFRQHDEFAKTLSTQTMNKIPP
ncbi:hypothetical protein LDG_8455 [Legionella drancourtii LLAP12]|uniref:Uncharacterized protein n=1 Tax=Legionella drancourtii LLAP12 TaxID=658187 RepID=G9ET26_9GAMM|nr:hypothetical protein LDG_8455 [Legionella drancourtii LLAP12]